MNRRTAFLVCGLLLIVAGLFLPREWYDALPLSKENLPPVPIKGVTLLQIALVIEGALLIFVSTRVWKWRPLDPGERLSQSSAPTQADLSPTLSNLPVVQRDDGMWSIGWQDDAPGPFESRQFAAAVAAHEAARAV